MKSVTINVVFDRKKTADNDKNKGLVQVRVTADRKTAYVSTGIKLFKNQWDERKERVKGSLQSNECNHIIDEYIRRILAYRDKCAKENTDFDFERMKMEIAYDGSETFLKFMERRITERGDIRETTRKAHLSVFRLVKSFGKITYFSDLTFQNITLFDDWLHKQDMKQTTIWSKHKVLKNYVNEALKFGMIEKSPYLGFRADKGKSEEGRYITEDEMRKIIDCKLPSALEKVRDLMIIEFYTGLAVSDLMNFDFTKIEDIGGHKALLDTRKKTDEQFYILLFNPVLKVLEKYKNNLPSMSMQQYNTRMKVVAMYAGIDKPNIASHWLRRGYGMMLINKGVPLEVVSKSMGHSSVRTTESTYAKLLNSTVIETLSKVEIKGL